MLTLLLENSLVVSQQHPVEVEAVMTFTSLSHALHVVQYLATSFVEVPTKLQGIFDWGHLRMVWRRFLLTSTLMVISLRLLLQQDKVDTQFLMPVLVDDT